MNSPAERENILGRIREALRIKAPVPGGHVPNSATGGRDSSGPPSQQARAWLPAVRPTVDERFALLAKNAADLKAGFHLLTNAEEAAAILQKLRDEEKWKKVRSYGSLHFQHHGLRGS